MDNVPIKTADNGAIPGRDNKGRFAVGSAGGPGRPPLPLSAASILRKIGDEKTEYKGRTMLRLESILRQVYEQAEEGKPWAVQWVIDRTDGKAIQRQEIDATVDARREDPETAIRQARALLAEMEQEPGLIEGPQGG